MHDFSHFDLKSSMVAQKHLSCEVALGTTPSQIIVLNTLPWKFMLVLDEFHPNHGLHPT